jgi:hypothetical protein
MRRFDLELSLSNFVESTEYSQFRCHHTEEFARRWCEFRNLAYSDQHFFFFSPAQFSFLIPGPQALPFDKEEDELCIESFVVDFQIPPQSVSYRRFLLHLQGIPQVLYAMAYHV